MHRDVVHHAQARVRRRVRPQIKLPGAKRKRQRACCVVLRRAGGAHPRQGGARQAHHAGVQLRRGTAHASAPQAAACVVAHDKSMALAAHGGCPYRVRPRGGEREAGAVVGRVDEDVHARCVAPRRGATQDSPASAPPPAGRAKRLAPRTRAARARRSATRRAQGPCSAANGRGAPGPAAALSVARSAESRPSLMYTLHAITGADVADDDDAPRELARGAPGASGGAARRATERAAEAAAAARSGCMLRLRSGVQA